MLDKTFDPKAIEKKHYDAWEQSGVFSCNPQSAKPPFTIMMPPPNVTGSLHMGHALNTALQDLLTRYHRMRGFDALWQPGTDHAGIATQMVVERMLAEEGLDRRKMGREKFLARVWDWKEQSGGTIVKQMRALGATPDWSRERFTMDEGLSRAVRKVFVDLYKQGLIYKDKRLVNWDTKFLTAISDLEVEHREIKGKLYHVRYPLEEGGFIAVATTRPETILADGAIAVHPDDEKYQHLLGKNAIVPVCNRIIPIIADEYVKSEFGSGAVKITAAHDYNDFAVYQRHKGKVEIPLINLMNPDGTINENCPPGYVGLDRFEARKKLVAELEALELLEKVEDRVHQVPYGDRSGTVVEPYLTEQWYVNAAELAKPAIEAVETGKMEFVPKQWENTYFSWMRDIQPWCISRQLWWGHQIPAWYDEGGNVYVAETEEEAQSQAGAGVKLTRDDDVLDTWFSSALWPFSTLGWPDETPEFKKYYPTDVLLTGFDIIFFWVARMMMMGLHFTGEVPFRKVYIHALVRDAKGQKMSKSKGNVMDPLDLTDKYGADALRFTLIAMAAQGRDIKMSEERIEGYRNFATKLWNASRYCDMNNCLPVSGFDPSSVKAIPNQWIVGEVTKTKAAIDKSIAEYKFNEAANAIYHFVWGTFCDWYLEFTKPMLQAEGPDAAEVRATTGWALDQIFILLNPFMPFITEELYATLAKRDNCLIDSAWPDYQFKTNVAAADEMAWLQAMIAEIRSVRMDMNVPAGAKINLLVKGANAQTLARIKTYNDILCKMARLEKIEITESIPKGAVQTVIGEAVLILPIADIIDLAAERVRLKKAIEKLEAEIAKIDQQLGNERFVAGAPPEIVEENKARKAEVREKADKLSQALKQLEAA